MDQGGMTRSTRKSVALAISAGTAALAILIGAGGATAADSDRSSPAITSRSTPVLRAGFDAPGRLGGRALHRLAELSSARLDDAGRASRLMR